MSIPLAVVVMLATGIVTHVSAMRCYSCASVSSAKACTNTTNCQDTEVCIAGIFIKGGTVKYGFGCEKRLTCYELLGDIGKRDFGGIHLCTACCAGDLCNNADCYTVQRNTTIVNLGTNPPPIGR